MWSVARRRTRLYFLTGRVIETASSSRAVVHGQRQTEGDWKCGSVSEAECARSCSSAEGVVGQLFIYFFVVLQWLLLTSSARNLISVHAILSPAEAVDPVISSYRRPYASVQIEDRDMRGESFVSPSRTSLTQKYKMDPFYLFTNQLAEEIARHSSTPTDEIDLVSLEEDVDEASSSIASSRNLLGGEREKRERIIVTLRVGLEGLKRRASSQSGQNYREVELEGDDLESQHQSVSYIYPRRSGLCICGTMLTLYSVATGPSTRRYALFHFRNGKHASRSSQGDGE